MKSIFPFRVPNPSRSFTIRVVGLLLVGLPCLPIASTAHAAAPITPSGLNTQVTLSQTPPPGKIQYDITGGTRPGGGMNLFHSFGLFNVPTNNIANFLNDSGLATSNILGRVTGGNISNIFGTIQTTNFGSANLFLMNPAGFLFGPNATVNVGGMMTFTTADYLRLTDGGRFNANPNAIPGDLLTSAPVAAFGFLGANPAAINFVGGQLTVAGDQNGTGVALIGGNISVRPDTSVIPNVPSSITAPGRSIQMTSVAGPGEVAADTGIPAAGMALGAITLGQGTTLSTVGDPSFGNGSGGAVSIRGGQLVATGAKILTNFASGTIGHGGDVTIVTTGSASITNSSIDTRTIDPKAALVKGGDAGAVSMTASDLILTNSLIFTGVSGDATAATLSTGAGGAVNLTGSDSVTLTRSGIDTRTSNSNGNGGAVTVIAPTVTLTNSGIDTEVVGPLRTTASGGPVTLGGPQTNSVSITGANRIILTDSKETEGNAGSVTITGQTITINGNGIAQTISTSTHHNPSLFGPFPTAGNAGDIQISGTNVTFNGAFFTSVADSGGTFARGGNISVNGAHSILADNGTVFTTTTVSNGNAGNIQLTSPHVTITGGSNIGSDTFAGGGSGTITVTGTENTSLDSGSLIATNADPGSTGPAGQIVFNTPHLTITGGSVVANQTLGDGPGGTVTVQGTSGPAQSVLVSDPGSLIVTNSDIGTGPGGNIVLNAHSVALQNGGAMFAGTNAAGNGGSILVKADSVSITGSSQVTSASLIGDSGTPTGNAGSVTIQGLASPAQSVLIDGPGSGIFTDTQGTGAGGNILVNANSVTLQNSGTLSATTSGPASTATGGIITVKADTVTLNTGGTMTAISTRSGAAGEITVQGLASPAQSVLIDGAGSGLFTNTSGTGAGGNIFVNADSVTLQNGGTLSAATSGTAASATGGMITVEGNTVHLNSAAKITTATSGPGNAGDILVKADTFSMNGGSTITADSTGSGQAGTVTIQGLHSPADSVLIDGVGSGVFTDTRGTGAGGNIFVNANSVMLQNGGTLSAKTSGTADTATGGTITVNANQVQLNSGGLITAATSGAGAGGSITIGAGSTFASNAGTVSSTATQATGGDISIAASQSVTLNNGSSISASSTGAGNAGSIVINAGQNFFSKDSSVTTEATAPGTQALGGNITVNAANMVQLTNSQINASVQGASETIGGNIVIDPQFVILQNSQILTQATQGQGGNITITTNLLLPDANSVISASSQFGVNGTVTIQSPISQAGGKIVPLGKSPLLATSLVNQRCAALAGGNFSSFTIVGRDSLPAEPGAWLSSPLALTITESGSGTLTEAGINVSSGELAGETPLLSLRQIAPPGFLTQTFAVDSLAGCAS